MLHVTGHRFLESPVEVECSPVTTALVVVIWWLPPICNAPCYFLLSCVYWPALLGSSIGTRTRLGSFRCSTAAASWPMWW